MVNFFDVLKYDAATKTAISVRDGVLEYLGSEIGEEPADKTFTVYRSPATIAQTSNSLIGLFLTDGHVSLDGVLQAGVGEVVSSDVVDLFDDTTESRLALKNKITCSDEILASIGNGNKELSLGYRADLVPHDVYDFEQRGIEPHHLAVVAAGRCGSVCSFVDKKMEEVAMKKRFRDEAGNPDLGEVMEVATELPEVLKNVPVEQLAPIAAKLAEVIAMASGDEIVDEEKEEEEVLDEEKEEKVMDEENEEKVVVTDSAEFKDAVKSAVARHTEVIEKARKFVDETYAFPGKSTEKIMRDALATEHGKTSFADAELNVAFKLLKKTESTYRNFGDAVGGFDKLKDKEI